MGSETGTPHVLLAPYLPLDEPISIGGWTAIPTDDIACDSEDGKGITDHARRLMEAYHRPFESPAEHAKYGAVFWKSGVERGIEFSESEFNRIQNALVVGILDLNPRLGGDRKDGNLTAHGFLTTDNARLYSHPYTGESSVAYITGAIAKVAHYWSIDPESDEPVASIPPPADTRLPMLPNAWAYDYAQEAYLALSNDSDLVRRIGRSIEWLDLAFRNSDAIGSELRIAAIRSGLESLLSDAGKGTTKDIRTAIQDLLGSDQDSRESRTWTRRGGAVTAELTAIEWWFQSFSELRNTIIHGNKVEAGSWLHDGVHHVDLGEWYLREAIKARMIRDAGAPAWLRDDGWSRMMRERYRAAGYEFE